MLWNELKKKSTALMQRQEDIDNLQARFNLVATKTPWIFQKCSIRGLVLVKECLKMIRDETNFIARQELIAKV